MVRLAGRYHDRIIGSRGGLLEDRGWRPNRIVTSCDRLLASLMRGDEGMAGILYLAVGEGLAGWDGVVPKASPDSSGLVAERARFAITSHDIVHVNAGGEPASQPTGRLRVTVSLAGVEVSPEGVLPLREFGLFGGDATAAADSGFMVNHVIHPRIDLTAGLTLQRTLRLDFAAGSLREAAAGSFGAALAVQSIDGVGEVYGAVLGAAGVHTLADLIYRDPHLEVADIPLVKLREFRTKARMVAGFQAVLAPFSDLAAYSVAELVRMTPAELGAGLSGEVDEHDLARFQEELMVLEVALDDSRLQEITLADLLGAS